MAKNKYIFLVPVVAVILVFIYLFYLESFNYDNYVYSAFHINISRFGFIPGLFLAAWAFIFSKTKFLSKILIVIFCMVSIPVGIKSIGQVAARTHQMFLGKNYIVQKTKREFLGDDYKFIEFIKNYLPSNTADTITLPPNEIPWRHTGNPQIMNSLLYPITTTNSTKSATPYMLISSEEDGASYHLWPDFKVSASKIIIYDWANDEAITILGKDWDASQWQDKKPWGLIIRK
jgi:hypothetical protein